MRLACKLLVLGEVEFSNKCVCILQFFDMFTNYAFSREEIDALFTAVVWPKV